jgi:hypothetical protein
MKENNEKAKDSTNKGEKKRMNEQKKLNKKKKERNE